MTKKDATSRRLERFGELAVEMGFCSAQERDKALAEQKRQDEAGEPHKLLGLVMLQLGTIDNEQLIAILKRYENRTT